MQFLNITKSTTFAELSSSVGARNVDSVLNANSLSRTPRIGQAFKDKCNSTIQSSDNISTSRKLALLDKFASDSQLYEKAALADESEWKLLSVLGTFENYLQIPGSVKLTDAENIIGGASPSISKSIYDAVRSSMLSTGQVDPTVFNTYSSIQSSQIDTSAPNLGLPTEFHIPWGEISIYSTLSDSMVDIPVYPEELSDARTANYTQMPDLLYQYEPWQIYQSSGPRSCQYTFKFHRDMWSGDHRKGGANNLIRFCQANCYPKYNGSAVHTSTVTLYIHGYNLITGVLTNVGTRWYGPIGQDGYYLACDMTLDITEVSQEPLNFESMRTRTAVIG